MELIKRLIAWERAVLILSAVVTAALLITALVLPPLFNHLWNVKAVTGTFPASLFLGAFVGFFVIGSAIVLVCVVGGALWRSTANFLRDRRNDADS